VKKPPLPQQQPSPATTKLREAMKYHQLGLLDQAERLYANVLAKQPKHFEAGHLLGLLRFQQGQDDEAHAFISEAVRQNPASVPALSNLGLVLARLGRLAEAVSCYDKALAIKPNHVEALINRGVALRALKRPAEALASYDAALAIRPGHAETLFNRGNALKDLHRPAEALTSYDAALAIRPRHAEALYNRGNALLELKRPADAVASFEAALAIKPGYAEALNNRGSALRELKRLTEALASYDAALAVWPGYAEALTNRGAVLLDLKRPTAALASFKAALAIDPSLTYAFNGAADCAIKLCDWAEVDLKQENIRQQAEAGRFSVYPFVLLGYCDDPAMQAACARDFYRSKVPEPPAPLFDGTLWRNDRICIAYLSADFHSHATAYLMAQLFELHDRSRFEVIGISFGPDDESQWRARLIKAFDQFHDVRAMTDREAAELVRRLQVDIAVDLKGHTQDARLGILAHRPAPVQVNYLGYPGTVGADVIDYILADKVLLPFELQHGFAERIVHLPGCYQVNDATRPISPITPTRAELGLPQHGFVFTSFNNTWKITRPVFEVWMRLLAKVEGSVLWLIRDNADAEANLRKEAAARGIDPARLVFAEKVPAAEHLARHRQADLFLDTLPVNAHTTASDALWAGLPLVTCQGQALAGRVASSLLAAIGLPELVTSSLEDYERLALALARDPARLGELKARLAQNRATHPLFDADRSRRHIEAAYVEMWERWQRGEPPRSFSVQPAG
jgi:predicted O-linked N-acetylglucosamine transferase (SPINDLY family)